MLFHYFIPMHIIDSFYPFLMSLLLLLLLIFLFFPYLFIFSFLLFMFASWFPKFLLSLFLWFPLWISNTLLFLTFISVILHSFHFDVHIYSMPLDKCISLFFCHYLFDSFLTYYLIIFLCCSFYEANFLIYLLIPCYTLFVF